MRNSAKIDGPERFRQRSPRRRFDGKTERRIAIGTADEWRTADHDLAEIGFRFDVGARLERCGVLRTLVLVRFARIARRREVRDRRERDHRIVRRPLRLVRGLQRDRVLGRGLILAFALIDPV